MKRMLALAAAMYVVVSSAMADDQGEEPPAASSQDALSAEVHDNLAEMAVSQPGAAHSTEPVLVTDAEMGEEFEILDSERQETEIEETGHLESEVDETIVPDDAE